MTQVTRKVFVGCLLAVLAVAGVSTQEIMKTFSVGSRNYQPDERAFELPPGQQKRYTAIKASFTRENWQAGLDYTLSNGVVVSNTALVVKFEVSTDNKATWTPLGEVTFPGGTITGPQGTVTTSTTLFRYSDVQTGDIRAVVQNLVTLRTAITLDLFEPADQIP
jgi:hypothetical protein